MTATTDTTYVPDVQDTEFAPRWADTAPRGGRTVLTRVLKDGAKVPMFLGQTLINSLRDLGYNTTTSAVCEHVDNAIQWGATEVRVYFHQTGKKGEYRIDALVYDNGQGMSPHVLKVATAFGGSMVYDDRGGIGRYGMGMKVAALNIGRVLDVYSWQEPTAFYNMTLDVDDIGGNRSNLIELPDPQMNDQLPSEVADILTRPMVYPKNPADSQTLLASNPEELTARLGKSGTIVFIPECDRLTYRSAQGLVDHAVKEMGRVYRRFIARGLKLYVNNRPVEATDPTFWMATARHTRVEGLTETRSQLVKSWVIDLPSDEDGRSTSRVTVKLFALPFEAWSALPKTVRKNALHLYDDHVISYVRNDREVDAGSEPRLKLKKHHTNNWLRLEIDFTGAADEAFGVAANKQGVRPKDYVFKRLLDVIGEEVTALRRVIEEKRAKQVALKGGSRLSEAERQASDADPMQPTPLPQPPAETADEKAALERNLQALALQVKRDGESDEDAYQRVTASRFLTVLRHDEYAPFYNTDFRYGRVILTVNTAHPFFARVWQPLNELTKRSGPEVEADPEADEETAGVAATAAEALLGVQLMLLSLGRAQGQMTNHPSGEEYTQLFKNLRKAWSDNLETQLNVR